MLTADVSSLETSRMARRSRHDPLVRDFEKTHVIGRADFTSYLDIYAYELSAHIANYFLEDATMVATETPMPP